MNFVNKDHFILVDLQAKSQTSIDVTDMKKSQSHIKIRQRILDNARLLIDDELNHVNGGFMKRFCQIVLSIVILGFSASAVFACHSNDMGAPNKGHHHYGKSSGILQHTEDITISTSTMTSCDFYTVFLEKEYDNIAEQAAQGHGMHLNVVADYAGCPASLTGEFGSAMRNNFEHLFSENSLHRSHWLQQEVTEMIEDTPELRQNCNSI